MNNEHAKIKIINPAKLSSIEGSTDYFTGKVQVTPIVQGETLSNLSCGCVMFEPSARSAWHTHPKGQLLVVTEGTGFVQEWGKPAQKIQKGDVIWTLPAVKHWRQPLSPHKGRA
jgi:quercetin dioxygenase-like cupin family protein